MDVIRLDDLKQWRARRIQSGACSFDDMQALGAFMEQVEKIEVKEGKWKRYYNNLICSECGHMSICYIGSRSYEYCPRCGAKMEADDDRIDYASSDE